MAITIATALSRLTGFLRVIAVAYAMGTTFMANTYQTANTAPNLLFELVAAGVLTSVFVPTFVAFIVDKKREEGWAVANVLSSAAFVGLALLSGVLALGAPLIMRLLTAGVASPELRAHEIEVGSQLLRLFAPQVVLYGIGMIMTAALRANRRFGLAAAAPIANNIVVIGVYLAYAAMRQDGPPSVAAAGSGEIWLLGLGTTAGVAAMTLVLVPQLRSMGWRFRFRWDPAHPVLRKSLRLGAWALGYAGGYQAGLVVVLLLANRVEGGVAAYQWAFTFFYLPHALFSVPIFSVLFTAMAEHAAREEVHLLSERIRSGLSVLLFLLVPVSAGLAFMAEPLAEVTLVLGVMDAEGAELVGRVLAAFAAGLPFYSVFLVFTRAFYAIGDTKIPALVNVVTVAIASSAGAAMFFTFPPRWAVPGLALGHSLGAIVGAVVIAWVFSARTSGGAPLPGRSIARVIVGTAVASTALLPAAAAATEAGSRLQAALWVFAGTLGGGTLYLVAMRLMGAPEPARIWAALIGRQTRPRDRKDG